MTRFSMSTAARGILAFAIWWIAAAGSSDAGGASLVNGYRRYNAACNHCHGPDGVGSTFAPSLIERPFDVETFRRVVLGGKANGVSVMKGFADDPNIAPYVDGYLRLSESAGRGRHGPWSSGAIGRRDFA